jgi:hypothetical protein
MAIGIVTALAQWGRSRGLAHRALFDAANLALSAGAAGVAFERIASLENSGFVHCSPRSSQDSPTSAVPPLATYLVRDVASSKRPRCELPAGPGRNSQPLGR